MKKSGRKLKSSYGWVVVVAGFFITLMIWGINTSLGVFFKPLVQSFQWSRGQTSLIWSINFLTFGVLALPVGPFTDRFGARKIMLIGGCLFCLGIIFSSQATSLWHLFILFGMLGSIGFVSTVFPLVVTVARWFDKRQGLAIGLAQSRAIGTFFISPLAAWLVASSGWQHAFLVLGVLSLITIDPLTFLIREPQTSAPEVSTELQEPDPSQDFNLSEALRTRTYWSLKLMVLGCCTCHSFLLLHLVNYLTDKGFTTSRAAMLFGILGVASAVGKIANGMGADRYGAKPVISGFLMVQGLGVLLFLRPDQPWLLYAGIIIWGIAQGGPMTCYAMLYRKYFGKRHLATLMSGFYFTAGFGMALGGLLGGVLYDVTGSYQLSFIISLITGVGASLIAMTLQPPEKSLMGEHRGLD